MVPFLYRVIQVGALKGHPKPFVTESHYGRWIPFE